MIKYKNYDIPSDLPLLTSVFFLIPYYFVLIRISSIPEITASLDRKRPQGQNEKVVGESEEAVLDKICRAANYYLIRLWRSKRPCLKRTLILYRWCCQNGFASRIVVGVKKNEHELLSHAWLELSGKPYRESPQICQEYTPILEG